MRKRNIWKRYSMRTLDCLCDLKAFNVKLSAHSMNYSRRLLFAFRNTIHHTRCNWFNSMSLHNYRCVAFLKTRRGKVACLFFLEMKPMLSLYLTFFTIIDIMNMGFRAKIYSYKVDNVDKTYVVERDRTTGLRVWNKINS